MVYAKSIAGWIYLVITYNKIIIEFLNAQVDQERELRPTIEKVSAHSWRTNTADDSLLHRYGQSAYKTPKQPGVATAYTQNLEHAAYPDEPELDVVPLEDYLSLVKSATNNTAEWTELGAYSFLRKYWFEREWRCRTQRCR